MEIEALLEGFSEKIEALKTNLQGEVIWTHVTISACILCWARVEHTVFSEIDRVSKVRNN